MPAKSTRVVTKEFAAIPFTPGLHPLESERGQSYGALSFEGNYGFSYAAVVARKIAPGVVEVTTRKYSVTTSKHTSLLAGQLVIAGWDVRYADF